MKKTNKKLFPLIIFSLIFLFNPSLNIVDLTPDFIAYLVLASLISASAEALPYFKEMKESFRRLAFLNIAKTVGALVMFANLSSGSDIIPLFTLIFNTLEVILLIGAVNHTASAMFYLGERTGALSLIRPYKSIFGIRMRPELLKLFTLIFCVSRGLLSFLPEISLLTYTDPRIKYIFQNIYIYAIIFCFGLSLIMSIVWLIMAMCYLRSVRNEDVIGESINSLISTERLEEINQNRQVKKKCGALTALFIASFFTLDIILAETGDVSILPPFIYGFFIIYIALRIPPKRWQKVASAIAAAVFCSSSLISYIAKIEFHNKYDYIDLYLRGGQTLMDSIFESPAMQAYIPVACFSVIEALSLVATLTITAIGFIDFIKKDTALCPGDPMYSRQDADYHHKMTVKSVILFVISALIGVAKCINVFLRANVKLFFSETATVIESSPLPWFHYVYLVLSVVLIFFSYFFLAEIKSDVKMKYSEKRISPELREETEKEQGN